MEIKRAAFVTSLANYGNYPGMDLPEIAIAGKSNVGKSSMINSICTRSKLAKVSGTPGKTRLLNIFRINDDFNMVDLPGYGFAKVPKTEIARWGKMMDDYFEESALLCHVLHLVDIRHAPTQDDKGMAEFLRMTGIPYTVIATKADKISKSQRARHVQLICRELLVQPWEVIPYSSEDGTGREAVLALFSKAVEDFWAAVAASEAEDN